MEYTGHFLLTNLYAIKKHILIHLLITHINYKRHENNPKKQLQELRQEMPVIDKKELMTFVGGDRYYFDTSGNYTRIPDSTENKIYAGEDTNGFKIDEATVMTQFLRLEQLIIRE